MDLGIGIVEFETLAVVVFEFTVPLDERPYLLRFPFLNAEDVIVEVGGEVIRRGVIGTIVIDDEDTLFVKELAQIDAVLVVVDTQHVGIEPNLTTADGGMAFLLEGDGLDVKFREHVSTSGTGLDSQFRQVFADLEFLEVKGRFEGDLNNLGFTVGVRREIDDP